MNEKSKNKERILIVDDSEMNRMILADMLEDQYEILEAADGAQGISILKQMSSQISLVLLDIVMHHDFSRKYALLCAAGL